MTNDNFLFNFLVSTLLTFLIAVIVLAFFSKDRVIKFVGFFSIKPVVAYWLAILYVWYVGYLRWTPGFHFVYVIYFLVEVGLLLTVVIGFRDLYKESKSLFSLLVVLDSFRWINILFLLIVINANISSIAVSFFLYIFPIMLAVFAFVFVASRSRRLRSMSGK